MQQRDAENFWWEYWKKRAIKYEYGKAGTPPPSWGWHEGVPGELNIVRGNSNAYLQGVSRQELRALGDRIGRVGDPGQTRDWANLTRSGMEKTAELSERLRQLRIDNRFVNNRYEIQQVEQQLARLQQYGRPIGAFAETGAWSPGGALYQEAVAGAQQVGAAVEAQAARVADRAQMLGRPVGIGVGTYSVSSFAKVGFGQWLHENSLSLGRLAANSIRLALSLKAALFVGTMLAAGGGAYYAATSLQGESRSGPVGFIGPAPPNPCTEDVASGHGLVWLGPPTGWNLVALQRPHPDVEPYKSNAQLYRADQNTYVSAVNGAVYLTFQEAGQRCAQVEIADLCALLPKDASVEILERGPDYCSTRYGYSPPSGTPTTLEQIQRLRLGTLTITKASSVAEAQAGAANLGVEPQQPTTDFGEVGRLRPERKGIPDAEDRSLRIDVQFQLLFSRGQYVIFVDAWPEAAEYMRDLAKHVDGELARLLGPPKPGR
jgi:hypothetical protein